LKLFGGPKKSRQKYRVVPRAPGDTAPLPSIVAESFRKAGIDPDRFTLAPFEAGEAGALPGAAFFTPGARLEHTFSFDTLNGALSAIERIVDDEVSARIGQWATKWYVVFDAPADAKAPASEAHQKIASRVLDLAAEDEGFSNPTMNVGRPVPNDD